MGLVLSLLPGLRELRTPLISGFLWLVFLLGAGWVNIRQLDSYVTDDLGLGAYSTVLRSSLILGIAFLLGHMAQSVITPIVRYMGALIRRRAVWLGNHSYIVKDMKSIHRRPHFLYRLISRLQLEYWPLSHPARNLLIDATTAKLTSAVSSSDLALSFPKDATIEALPYCAPQLAQNAPAQYQDFDRLRSEADLRVAAAPALLAVSTIFPAGQQLANLFVGATAATVLLIQAAGRERQAMDILANAAFLGYIEIPIVKAVTEGLGALPVVPLNDHEWRAGLIVSLYKRGYFEESDMTLHEIFSDCDEMGGATEIKRYLEEHCPSSFRIWEHMEKGRTETLNNESAR